MPLTGRRVLITRKADPDCPLVSHLEATGAEVLVWPLVSVTAVEAFAPVDVSATDWVLFTSQNAVKAFLENPEQEARLRVSPARLGVVGTATAKALAARGFTVSLMPDRFEAEALAERFIAEVQAPAQVLWPCGNLARPTLKTKLEAAGHTVTPLVVYETLTSEEMPAAVQYAAGEQLDVAAFCSPSAVEAFAPFAARFAFPPRIACIGPETAAAARELLGRAEIVAPVHTLAGLAESIERALYDDESED